MGTDIHLYVEKRDASDTWQCIPPPAPPPRAERTEKRTYHPGAKNHLTGEALVGDYDYVSPWWGPNGCMYVHKCWGKPESKDWDAETATGHERCEECMGTGRDLRWYSNRNYDAFAILTGTVRNGFGFAGVKTGEGFRGITAQPRGEPRDLSKVVHKHHSWDHSPSWLTLAELLAFDWEGQRTGHTGVIPLRKDKVSSFNHHEDDYVTWRDRRPVAAPKSWSGAISGQKIVTVRPPEADRILAHSDDTFEIDLVPGDLEFPVPRRKVTYSPTTDLEFYVQIAWGETYAESAADFLAFVRTFLAPLADGGDAADVRIVFGFDS